MTCDNMRTRNGAINCSSVYVHFVSTVFAIVFVVVYLISLLVFLISSESCACALIMCLRQNTPWRLLAPQTLSTFGRFFLWGHRLFALLVNSISIRWLFD